MLSSSACLDTIEPTATSPAVAITTVSADGRELDQRRLVGAGFAIENTGTRRIYIDRNYFRLEKLVNQRWELAAQDIGPFSPGLAGLAPGRTTFTSKNFIHDPAGVTPLPMIEHVRGLYRMGFRISFAPDGTDLLPADESYSQPFGVTCC
ncbi:MAG TPA: hypothetical protein VJL35_08030 [Gemmatimonadaceae bacterium]|nr:hypothetical protein [Gemmatimonadaceae bacterium]